MNYFKLALPITIVFLLVLACSKPSTNTSRATPVPESTPAVTSTPETVAAKPSPSTGSDLASAVADYNSHNYERAATSLEQITRNDPKNLDAQVYLGKSYLALSKDDAAIDAFQNAVAIKADHPEANYNLGNIYYGRKDFQASLPFYKQAVKSKGNSAEYLMALGENQRMLKQYDVAIVQYGRVIGFEPNNAKAYYSLGLTYIGLNNKIGARQQARKLESLDKELSKNLTIAIGDK
jgi:tetratricopeptide (TPR) repeat protein